MILEARPRKLRSTRSLWAVTKTMWPNGMETCFRRSSENMLPTLLPGGLTKYKPLGKTMEVRSPRPCSAATASWVMPTLPTVRPILAHNFASRLWERWSTWFSSAAISRRETTARCMLTNTPLKMPTYLPTVK